METAIVFLGTAGDSYTMGKQLLSAGGIIISDPKLQLHLNPGPGSLSSAKQYGIHVRDTDVVVVSDSSLLHSGDLNAVIHAMTLGGEDKKGVLVGPRALMAESEKELWLRPQEKAHLHRLIGLTHQDSVEASHIHIKPTESSDGACGYLMEADKYTLGYTGPTPFTKTLAKQYKGADILIVNLPPNLADTSDSRATQLVDFIKESEAKLAVLTDISFKLLPDPLVMARFVQRKSGVTTVVAKDGLSIDPTSHASKLRQKFLKAYE